MTSNCLAQNGPTFIMDVTTNSRVDDQTDGI